MSWMLATDPTSLTGLPSLVSYGVAAPFIAVLLGIIRWMQIQLNKKDAALERANDRLIMQGDAAIKQAEKLSPLISEAARVLDEAMRELPQERRRRDWRRSEDNS